MTFTELKKALKARADELGINLLENSQAAANFEAGYLLALADTDQLSDAQIELINFIHSAGRSIIEAGSNHEA